MKTCNRAHEDLVADIAARELGGAVTLVPIPTYPDTIVYEAVADDRKLVFKAVDPDGRDQDGIGLEAWACEEARLAGVPAPRILLVDTTGLRFPGSYLVMERAAGECLERLALATPVLEALLRELGTHLRVLHETRIPGFGWLDESAFRTAGSVRGRTDTWRDALLEEIPQSLDYLAQPGALTGAEVDHARRVIEVGIPLVSGWTDGRLLHGDIGLLHVWVDPDELRVTSLIDFGERSSGDPAFDFGDLEGRQLRHVLTGYAPDRPDEFAERLHFYPLARALPWARKWHARGEAQVLDWVRHLLHTAAPS